MLYHLLYPLSSQLILFNVFKYITFRAIMATLTALMISFLLGRPLVDYLRAFQIGQMVRDDGPKSHLEKSGTPTMGGLLIIFAMTFSCLLWTRLDNLYFWIVLLVVLGYGAIGFFDDYLKITRRNHRGLSGKRKLLFQFLIGGIVGFVLWLDPAFKTTLAVPFFKNVNPDLGILYIPFVALVIAGASNAVNLTDGLDGLAIGPVMICAATYLVFAYIAGHLKLAHYLQVSYVPGAGELTVLCGAMLGAGLGFLWYNAYPAEVFMGDVGSLSLGGLLGAVAVVTKHEILLAIAGGVFVIEAVSVILQVASFKTTGKRIFNMAPIHHHFELKGWPEPKVIVRFWIISVIFALLALGTLKLR
ncbi:phospho-N-acetylmuramoyl-pentapeptide-transferase [Desulfomonile tiedjei]|uniref:Phospho-N-acetylmuramoyl-pentapeptide-transferase n=1 Tax=Desulfomonile tiedjei (strain ATCC 49306 / DSM 6799 / DCB-1) TaxID=706587 RepID=I4CCN5_DESTA|nr:phospho-N-acetylmuramoyl-pentapeptide-transferase [Desulfomonile tiedjei]AFM27326.1 Phospho-N-acetylmuramoyl-pentapeptide-transferase [Desulfomonile tiedjei DSM 6799]